MKVKTLKLLALLYIININISKAQQWGTPQSFGGVNPATSVNFNDVCYTSISNGYIVGNGGTILKTINGGQNWTTQTSGTSNDLKSVHFVNANDGWACGTNGIVLKTTNAGISWQTVLAQTSATLNAICTDSSGQFVIIAGSSGTLKRKPSVGSTWLAIGHPYGGNEFTCLSIVTATNFASGGVSSLWVGGKNGTCGFSTDWGINWSMTGGGGTYSMSSIHARNINPGNVWFVGASGLKRKTNDNGGSWQAQTMGTSNTLNNVSFSNHGIYGHSVGDNGTIVNTTDGGTTWLTENSTSTQKLNAVYRLDAQTSIAVGNNGTVLLYRNGVFTGINNTPIYEGGLIYPNPTSHEINAELSFAPKTIKIYDITGKQVLETNTFPINVSQLENGIYFIQIHSENGFANKKIIVSK